MAGGRRRRLLLNLGLIGVLVAAGVAAYLLFNGDGDESENGVATATVARGNVRSTVSASGTVESPRTVGANFVTGGTVTDLQAEVGDHVSSGEVLAHVDDSSYRVALQSAYAGVESAEAGLVSAQANLVSAQASLEELKEGDPTEAQLAQAEAAVTSARAQIDQAEASISSARAQVTQAQEALDGTELTAPISGTVLSISGDVGSTASSGGSSSSQASTSTMSDTSTSSSSDASGFVVICDLDHLRVQAYFSETDTAHLKVGQRARVTLNALPGKSVRGKVVAIDATSTTVNQVVDYGVTIKLHRQPRGIRVGQTAVVVVITGVAKDVLYVPSSAVTTLGKQSSVTLLQDGEQVSTLVEVGLEGDEYTEIVSGLSEGDEVVISLATGTTGTGNFPGGGFPGGGVMVGGGGGA
ncbi:MAG: HlyD family efflux transporter periplasmic adaptor subunit [Actinomycetota bacterium]